MPRQGLPSFLLDTSLDEKWQVLESRFGLKGFAIAVRWFQMIYGIDGYYCRYDASISLAFAHSNHVNFNLVEDVICTMVSIGLFDSEQYTKNQILTSIKIQNHFFKTKRRAKEVRVKSSFLCAQFDPKSFTNLIFDDEKGGTNKDMGLIKEKTYKKNFFETVEKNIGRLLSQSDYELVMSWKDIWDADVVALAIEQAKANQVTSLYYVNRILQNWQSAGITDLQGAKQAILSYKKKKEKGNPKPAANWDKYKEL